MELNIKQNNNKVELAGALVADNLDQALVKVKQLIANSDANKKIEMSFSGITKNNSICIAFILCCLRYAKLLNRQVILINFSKELNDLLDIYNLASVIKVR